MRLKRSSAMWVAMMCVLLAGPWPAVSDDSAPTPGGDAWDGDSVDLSTGLFVHRTTDLHLDAGIPLTLRRTYRQGDTAVRQFGIGSSHPYQMFLSVAAPYQEAFVHLADGSRIRYVRTTPGTDVAGAVFEHVDTPTSFYRSSLKWDGSWNVSTADGRVYMLHANVPLQRIEDQYNRVVEVLRQGQSATGLITSVLSVSGFQSTERRIIFGYDGLGRIVQARDSLGRIVAYTYDAGGRLASVTDPDGGVTQYTYDGQHRMLTIRDPRGAVSLTNEYDAAGRVVRQTLANLGVYHFAYTLDGNGKVVRTDVTNPRGVARRVTFDARGYRVSDTRALGTPIAQTTAYERDSSGLLLAMTDALGRRTAFTRDANGNVASATRLAGSPGAATTTIAYAPAGDWGVRRVAGITDPLGHTTSLSYDRAGYPAAMTDSLGSRTYIASFEGSLLELGDPLGHATVFRRDNGDNVVNVLDPLGRKTTEDRDSTGRLLTHSNPLGATTAYAYDRRHRLTQITDAAGGATRFQYDANGNLVIVTDARGNESRFIYDSMNRLTGRIDPIQRSESYSYDANGNLTSATDRKGQTTTITYDALDRPVAATYADGSTASYVWDAGSRLVQVADSLAGTITRTWDLFDRLRSETTALGTVTHAYDAAGRRTAMTAEGQPTVAYGYDAASQVTHVSRGGVSAAASYDAAGRRTSVTLPNGITATYAYDAASQLTGLTYRRGAEILGTLTYAYDPAGNRVRAGGTWARIGLPSAIASASYDDANRPLVFGAAVLTHDANGNLASDGANIYTWNPRDQLVAVDGVGTTARFAYDALGRRHEFQMSGLITQFLYDGLTAVEEVGSAGDASVLGGFEIDQYLALGEPGENVIPLPDGLGSVLALTDDVGTVTAEHTYQPFGASAGSTAVDPNPYRFTGREDDATGLHFHRARYYHPTLQRFISESPVGVVGGNVNRYLYARNSPINAADPLGLGVDSRRPRSFAAMAMATWDPTRGRPVPTGGVPLPGLLDADAALLEQVIMARVSPEVTQALDAIRQGSPSAREGDRRGCMPLAARVFEPLTTEQAIAHLLVVSAAAPDRCGALPLRR